MRQLRQVSQHLHPIVPHAGTVVHCQPAQRDQAAEHLQIADAVSMCRSAGCGQPQGSWQPHWHRGQQPVQGAMGSRILQHSISSARAWPGQRRGLQPCLPPAGSSTPQASKHGSSGGLPHLQPCCCDGAAVAKHQGGELLEFCDTVQRLHLEGTRSLHWGVEGGSKLKIRPDILSTLNKQPTDIGTGLASWAWAECREHNPACCS